MTNRAARWFKAAGGDFGAMRVGGTRVWYDCLYCARRDRPVLFQKPRWRGPPSHTNLGGAGEAPREMQGAREPWVKGSADQGEKGGRR